MLVKPDIIKPLHNNLSFTYILTHEQRVSFKFTTLLTPFTHTTPSTSVMLAVRGAQVTYEPTNGLTYNRVICNSALDHLTANRINS